MCSTNVRFPRQKKLKRMPLALIEEEATQGFSDVSQVYSRIKTSQKKNQFIKILPKRKLSVVSTN